MDIVSIVTPTYKRNASLKRALASLCNQKLPGDIAIEIIAVDNTLEGNARSTVAELENLFAERGVSLTYLNEPNPGVATARNSGVQAARGRWVAFLDDDEEAGEEWIADLVAIARQTGADGVFGPVEGKSDGARAIGPLAPYFSRRFERDNGADITDLAAYLGTNNSMFDRLKCLGGRPFDQSLNEWGGEDSLLLRHLVLNNRRFAWASDALVYEWAAQRRLNWAYVRKRKFLSGQIRVFVNHMAQPARWDQIAIWMAAGLAQFIMAGLAAAVLWPVSRLKAEQLSATAWGGLGKVLWTPRFRPALYGTGLVS